MFRSFSDCRPSLFLAERNPVLVGPAPRRGRRQREVAAQGCVQSPASSRWLFLEIEDKDGEPTSVLASPCLARQSRSKDVHVEGRRVPLGFDLGSTLVAGPGRCGEGGCDPEGTARFPQVSTTPPSPGFERTEAKELAKEDAQTPGPAATAFEEAQQLKDLKEHDATLKESAGEVSRQQGRLRRRRDPVPRGGGERRQGR